MTNKAFNFVQPIIDIPSDLSTFKQRPQVRWTGNDWAFQNSVDVNYGDTAGTWSSSTNFETPKKSDLYSSSQSNGFRVRGEGVALGRESLYMINANSRWMPASVFNGVGFETYYYTESNNTNHQLYVGAYGVVFKHRTNSGQLIFGWDTGNTDSPGSDKYRFDRIPSTHPDVATIRRWGSDYLLQGLLVSFKSKGSGIGSTTSYVDLYNLKFGSQYSVNASNYKVHPLALRPYSGRDMHTGGTNKFAYFKPNLF